MTFASSHKLKHTFDTESLKRLSRWLLTLRLCRSPHNPRKCLATETAPLQRYRNGQRPPMATDTAPLQRYRKRQRTEEEDVQLQPFNKRSHAVVRQWGATVEELGPNPKIRLEALSDKATKSCSAHSVQVKSTCLEKSDQISRAD